MLRDIESKPPSLEEVRASLPPGVKLVRYEPKQSPIAVAPVSVVTNVGIFRPRASSGHGMSARTPRYPSLRPAKRNPGKARRGGLGAEAGIPRTDQG